MPTEPNIHEVCAPPGATSLRRSIEYHLRFTAGKSPTAATLTDWRLAVPRASCPDRPPLLRPNDLPQRPLPVRRRH